MKVSQPVTDVARNEIQQFDEGIKRTTETLMSNQTLFKVSFRNQFYILEAFYSVSSTEALKPKKYFDFTDGRVTSTLNLKLLFILSIKFSFIYLDFHFWSLTLRFYLFKRSSSFVLERKNRLLINTFSKVIAGKELKYPHTEISLQVLLDEEINRETMRMIYSTAS